MPHRRNDLPWFSSSTSCFTLEVVLFAFQFPPTKKGPLAADAATIRVGRLGMACSLPEPARGRPPHSTGTAPIMMPGWLV